MSRLLSRENLLLGAILALAAFFRFYRLDQLPPGFQFDQAFYVFDVLRLLQGQFAIFFAAPGGSEPLYLYLAMVGVALSGVSALGLKLTSATIGVLTIPLIYGFARSLFSPSPSQVADPRSEAEGRDGRGEGIALLAALFAAISFWHIFFTRYGERVTLLALLTLPLFWFLWRALDKLQWRDFAFTGVFTALALYTYPGSRVLPIALVILTAYAAWSDRSRAVLYLKGLALALGITALVFLPLGIYFSLHPDQFISHAAQVSIFVPHGNVQANVGAALLKNAVRVLGMFFIAGDGGALRNLPGRPIFDPLVGALFLAGVIALGTALFSPGAAPMNRKRAVFLLAWLAVTLAISLFTDDAPNFVRTLPALPAVMILPAWGASAIWERLRTFSLPLRRGRVAARHAAVVVFTAIAAASTWFTYRDYFIVLANDPGTYYVFDVDKVETSTWINQNAPLHHLFLAPLWYQNGTLSLLTRNAPLKSFESRDTIVLPSGAAGKDALFAFPFEQEKKIQTMATRLGALGAREELTGSNGGKLLLIYRVPARNLPDAQNPMNALARGGPFLQPQKIDRATWADQIELLGYSVDPEGPGGRNLVVTLFLHSLRPMTEDFTFSLKVRDEKERVWGQEDKWLGDSSYDTAQWGVGDVVIEKFYPGLEACAPAGDYRITVEAYNPKTMRVLALTDRDETAVALGATYADVAQSNRLEDLQPDQKIDADVAPQLRLMGFTLTPNQVRAGGAFSLTLFWRGQGDGAIQRGASLRLRDASRRDFALAEKTIALPVDGRGVCTLFDLRAPADLAPGAASILVNEVKITSLNIVR